MGIGIGIINVGEAGPCRTELPHIEKHSAEPRGAFCQQKQDLQVSGVQASCQQASVTRKGG